MYSPQNDLPMTAYCGNMVIVLKLYYNIILNCNWFASQDLVRTAPRNFGFKHKSIFFFYKVLSTILNYHSSIKNVL